MANELQITTRLKYAKGNSSFAREPGTINITVTGTHHAGLVQSIGTTHEALNINSDVATLGVAYFRNLDATNYVEVGIVVSGTFYAAWKFKATEGYPVRLVPGVTYYAKANTAAVDLDFVVIED